MVLAPLVIPVAHELLSRSAQSHQGVGINSKLTAAEAAVVAKVLGFVVELLEACQDAAVCTNIKARQLQRAGEQHLEIVQNELADHVTAAERHRRVACSTDWDTIAAATPTTALVGATAGSTSSYLAAQAAYAAACNTWAGWLFGVAAPAGFAATVLPFALPAAAGVAATGYCFWKGKKDREAAADRERRQWEAHDAKLQALITFTHHHRTALAEALTILDHTAVDGQAVSVVTAELHLLALQTLALLHNSNLLTDNSAQHSITSSSKMHRTAQDSAGQQQDAAPDMQDAAELHPLGLLPDDSPQTTTTTTARDATSTGQQQDAAPDMHDAAGLEAAGLLPAALQAEAQQVEVLLPAGLHEVLHAVSVLEASWWEVSGSAGALASSCGVAADSSSSQVAFLQGGCGQEVLRKHGLSPEGAAGVLLGWKGGAGGGVVGYFAGPARESGGETR